MENEIKEPAPKYNYITPDEYLAMERASDAKHEYYDGFVVAMSGARLRHNQIVANLITKIGNYLENKNCRILPSDMRVSTPNRDSYMYPDALIFCDDPKLEDEHFDTLKNPSVIFEVWSPSTQKNDVGDKLRFYQLIPTLKEYVMIDAARRFVQVVRREANDAWRFENIDNLNGDLHIQTINFRLSLNDIYRNTDL